VSSLVHSSTLVTAGVYLLLRLNYLFVDFEILNYIFTIGAITIIMARIRALVEADLKKIVALSTLRQLGIIVSLLGLGLPNVRFLHLLAHAYFKALMFLSTGEIIHNSLRGQDIR
jgi:NADH-ubiquinone oxidoreductase chain 5